MSAATDAARSHAIAAERLSQRDLAIYRAVTVEGLSRRQVADVVGLSHVQVGNIVRAVEAAQAAQETT